MNQLSDTGRAEHKQALLAAIVASTDDAIISKTMDGLITSWNPGAEKIFGYSEAEAVGEHISIIIPGDRLHEEEYIISQISLGKRIDHFETIRQKKNGSEVNISVTISPIIDKSGRIIGASKIARDTSVRTELAKIIENSEERSRAIVEAAPFPIGVYIGREMRIALMNKAIIEVWGKGGNLTGKTYQEALPELENTGIYQQLENVYDTGLPFQARNQRVNLAVDGQLKPFYFNYDFTPLRDLDGNVYGVMNTAADVTDLVLAKQQVERSEQNFRDMISQAPVAMAILMGESHIVTVANKLMIDVWGKPSSEIMQRPVFEALPDARGQGFEVHMDKVYKTGETYYANEMPVQLIRHGDPELIYQNFVFHAYKDADGTIKGVIVITTDVTEQVIARRKIESSEKELRNISRRLEKELSTTLQLQQHKDDFLSIASHELKTPLTSLSVLIQISQEKLRNSPDPFLANAMDKAIVQVKKMVNLINGFLDVSRLEAGKIILNKRHFDLEELTLEIIEEVRLVSPDHELVFTRCGALPVNADPEKIGSVLSNLLANAIKYSPSGSRLEATCNIMGNEAIVSIKDQGMGIAQDDLQHIFDRYYRVSNPKTKNIAGFGIGLYLSAEIIRLHDGRIWAESEEGNGSLFHFALPTEK